MIRLNCDRCERVIEVQDAQAGTKIQCPDCGDVNVVPIPGPEDRAQKMGLVPDSGPEQRVMIVRPAMLRARPMTFLGLVLLGVGGIVLGIWALMGDRTVLAGLGAGLVLVGAVTLAAWKIRVLGSSLEITNKRTIERRGLFSRASSEVVHDNIRNLQIHQTFWQRIWGVGQIGISSSGQDGIEISMRDLARPQRIRETIDAYRPL